MKTRFVTEDVMRRVNDRLMGNLPAVKLSTDDEKLLSRIKSSTSYMEDNSRLREIFRKARGDDATRKAI